MVMTSTPLRVRDNNGIKIDADLRKHFPAIFNTRRSTRVSEDYKLYRSDKVIDIMIDNGMKLVEVSQERVGWSKVRQPHTQIHTMRFQSEQFGREGFGVGDSFPEVVVRNSHDGRSVFQAMAGVFRLICSNGMVVSDMDLGSITRRHYGEANAFDKVAGIIADLPAAVEKVGARIAAWDGLMLSEKEQAAMARLLIAERGKAAEWIKPEMVLEARREADRPNKDGMRSAWLAFNVLQEALTNATITHQPETGRARSIRPINSSFGNLTSNRRLWAQAEAYIGKLAKKRGLEIA